jgi:hypothetical protein
MHLLLEKESSMAGTSVKNENKYNALERKGRSKSRAARMANAGRAGSRTGGRKSHN